MVASQHGIPITILGSSSNVPINDAGIPGLVLQYTDATLTDEVKSGQLEIVAGAAVVWDDVVVRSLSRGGVGIECLSGIPGSVGAGPVQNIGAYGQEVGAAIASVRALDVRTGRITVVPQANCAFGYRTSAFKTVWRTQYMVLGVTFRLSIGAPETPRHPEVLARAGTGSAAEIRAAVLSIRESKGMLIGHKNSLQSVGSFFVNPSITVEAFAALQVRYTDVPHWKNENGSIKLSAAWLVEKSGFHKGKKIGAVGISPLHTLAIVNYGGANSAAVVHFAREIQRSVQNQFAVWLEPEPQRLGFSEDPLGNLA
jgi:UDP-N-acetylmuramate dehydrogenase